MLHYTKLKQLTIAIPVAIIHEELERYRVREEGYRNNPDFGELYIRCDKGILSFEGRVFGISEYKGNFSYYIKALEVGDMVRIFDPTALLVIHADVYVDAVKRKRIDRLVVKLYNSTHTSIALVVDSPRVGINVDIYNTDTQACYDQVVLFDSPIGHSITNTTVTPLADELIRYIEHQKVRKTELVSKLTTRLKRKVRAYKSHNAAMLKGRKVGLVLERRRNEELKYHISDFGEVLDMRLKSAVESYRAELAVKDEDSLRVYKKELADELAKNLSRYKADLESCKKFLEYITSDLLRIQSYISQNKI